MDSFFFMRSTTLTALAIVLALIFGVLLGRIFGIASRPIPPTVLLEDRRPLIPVVRISGVEDGFVAGSVRGDVRVFLDEKIVVTDGSGSFRVPAGDFLHNVATVRVPADMRFVASRRGKKYYPVTSASAARLAPGNRVYFSDRESAERAGFLAGE